MDRRPAAGPVVAAVGLLRSTKASAANLGASFGLVLLHCPWSPAAVLLRSKAGRRPGPEAVGI